MTSWLVVVFVLLGSIPLAYAEDRCTAILVGAKSSSTGAPMTTHTNDCSSCDYRIAKVPQQNHSVEEVHQIVLANANYPRYVGTARGDVFKKENLDQRFHNWTNSPAIGVIPQVSTTFAYIDGLYGIINEHQVAIGESTCGARFVAKPMTQGGQALFDVAELSRIALQRTKTAREAIQLMGDLAVKYGYYGAEWEGDDAHGEAGEALTITDTKEAWMFHILPDDTGKSAIWVAQRVPDDHVSVVANQFVIHEIDLEQKDYFMASFNIYDVAIRNHIWSPDTNVPFDFTREYSQPRESTHQYYSTRRMWRVFTLVDPQLDLSPYTDVYASDYPFSIKVPHTLTPHDLMRFQRDHYENTPFDMTKGPAGGPYGNPDRYDGGVNGDVTKMDLSAGHFERAISIFRASYSFVSVLDPSNTDHAFLWFGQYAPHATSYAPVYAKSEVMPTLYSNSSLHSFDRDSSFWIYALVGNWASRFYIHAHAFVEKVQLELENKAERLLIDIEAEAARIKRRHGEVEMRQFLTNQTAQFAKQSHVAFSDLFEDLVTTFHDGYQVSGMFTSRFNVHPLFYPKWWLELVGFFNGSSQPAVLPLHERNKNGVNVTATESSPRRDTVPGVSYVTTAIIAVAAGGVGLMIGKKYAPDSYEPIR